MNQFDLGSILDELHEKEFSEFCNVPMHHFFYKASQGNEEIIQFWM